MKRNRVVSRDRALQMGLDERVRLEAEITDARHETVEGVGSTSDWDPERFFNQSPWRRFVFDSLEPIAGKTILDLGCGYHPTPIHLALAGAAHVVATDVSPKALRHVRELAEKNGLTNRISAIRCPAEALPLDDEQVDLVHGEGVLHHLDISRAGPELARVLKPGGRAVFKDPLGQNPLLEAARDYLPYPDKHPAKGTDHPLTFGECEDFGSHFSSFSYRGFGFFSMLSVPLFGRQPSRLGAVLNRMDRPLLSRFPSMERFCRFVVTRAEKAA